ncbi:hypothetical protein MSBR3_2721 [Methanosarcina barkeri 3]|uniref:Uncharacterized protein n=1 Tax=Methanosarcina barkeri 3 TaxID=1434107 RepID=A0A0E3WXW0_METBA|nr:hypothetical protein MSBR3_2721 [Methanosarcina barkeri 3]
MFYIYFLYLLCIYPVRIQRSIAGHKPTYQGFTLKPYAAKINLSRIPGIKITEFWIVSPFLKTLSSEKSVFS